ncbi:uncharacterized protein PHACADRAFT_33524 [Phanerochaete carnosa HHB-10118-sp]|uniref:Uncharacterized protein n=1 Tax=Phanerochaete carnosa (strain HHB-10118-sp) TaxID=650164 RepID=K5WGP6_PHACS|nr:uncharacterized protein PHACADRAFT_33524 [Phanerochaete carnosa HHB-10118-sp]EKM49347.1 hypothetical protein PHACADRAFT_33524 [Phanerochaete carnosa HHB-10118-sp]
MCLVSIEIKPMCLSLLEIRRKILKKGWKWKQQGTERQSQALVKAKEDCPFLMRFEDAWPAEALLRIGLSSNGGPKSKAQEAVTTDDENGNEQGHVTRGNIANLGKRARSASDAKCESGDQEPPRKTTRKPRNTDVVRRGRLSENEDEDGSLEEDEDENNELLSEKAQDASVRHRTPPLLTPVTTPVAPTVKSSASITHKPIPQVVVSSQFAHMAC